MANSPIHYPGDVPPVTVDDFVADPTRVTRYISDLGLMQYFHEDVFSYGGGVTGGAVRYDQLTENDLFLDRDVEDIAPGAEYPILTDTRGEPLTASVQKFGGKWFTTDEAKRRNDIETIRQPAKKAVNNMYRRMDRRALALFEASLAANASQVIAGSNWATATTTTTANATPAKTPLADLVKIVLKAEANGLGVVPDLLLVNPIQKANLTLLYGAGNVSAITSDYGLEIKSSIQVPNGVAYALEKGQVGQIRDEVPLYTTTWREEGTDRDWFKISRSSVMFITDPGSVFKIQGLNG